jgi:hypothetical protein
MMRYRVFCFAATLAVLVTANALAQSVALTGSLRTANGPVSGANVYVVQTKDANGNSVNGSGVGPVVTSGTGAFTFYNLPAGLYAVSVSVQGTTVWSGAVEVPGRLSPIVLH